MKRRRGIAAIAAIAAGALACNVLLGNEDGVFVRGDNPADTGTLDATANDGGVEENDAPAITDAAIENGGCDARPNDDPQNCGACGHDCLGGDCRSGKCLPVVMSEDAGAAVTQRMATSDEGIYIVGGGTLHRVGLDGGPASTQYTPAAGNVLSDIAVSPTKVVFAQAFGPSPSIRSCPLGACPDAAVESDSIAGPHALSLVGERAFWADLNAMYATAPGGGAPALFQSEDISTTAPSPTRIYWARSNTAILRSAFPDGGDVTSFVPDSGGPISSIAVTDDGLVWVANATLHIGALDGGSARRLTALSSGALRIGVAGDQVYWLESGSGVLRRCALAGTCVGEAVSLKCTADFAITQRAIWWVEEEGRLLRLAR
jgi:hypothetical protein